jgi:hypothetical protein
VQLILCPLSAREGSHLRPVKEHWIDEQPKSNEFNAVSESYTAQLISMFAEICETLSVTHLQLVAENGFTARTASRLEKCSSKWWEETRVIGAEMLPYLPDPHAYVLGPRRFSYCENSQHIAYVLVMFAWSV